MRLRTLVHRLDPRFGAGLLTGMDPLRRRVAGLVHEQLASGRKLRVASVVDAWNRPRLLLAVDLDFTPTPRRGSRIADRRSPIAAASAA